MEILANDQQLQSLASIFTYYYPQSRCSIIIATSDPMKNEFLQTDFEQKNHCIEMYNSNASILRALHNHVVDVVIINNDYDSMEGIKLLESIRKIDQQLPVVFIDKVDSDLDLELFALHILLLSQFMPIIILKWRKKCWEKERSPRYMD